MIDLDTLYRRYSPEVLRFAIYLCGDRALAEDLTADAFIRALLSTRPVRVGTVKAYLFTIVRNLYRDRLRHGRRQRELAGPLAGQISDPGPGPDVTAGDRDELQRTLDALQQLPELDRAVLAMAAFDQMPYDLIAQALGISVPAVKVRMYRARLRLTASLDGTHQKDPQ
jgi:RNA polymerase sigma-70 factor (ECF subfamily)